jgi:hypothetical protein
VFWCFGGKRKNNKLSHKGKKSPSSTHIVMAMPKIKFIEYQFVLKVSNNFVLFELKSEIYEAVSFII